MKKRFCLKGIFFGFALTFSSDLQTGDVAYASLRYESAFDLSKVNEKHKKLLVTLGCAQNVLSGLIGVSSADTLNVHEVAKAKEQYQKDCLKHLQRARLKALAEPGMRKAFEIALCAGAYCATMQVLESDSMGGSFAGFAYIQHMLFALPDIAMTLKNMTFRPNNGLQDLEERFAQNQCFIPKNLWKKINNVFTEARSNHFTREAKVVFLDFALDLKTLKKPTAISFKNDMNLDEIKQELARRIKQYFEKYDNVDSTVNAINRNVSKFIDAMIDYQKEGMIKQAPRYLYLHGSGGIGKTYFAQQLSRWINELLLDVVCCEDVVIEANSELEGSATHPGVVLNALRNQLRDDKHGSIVMLDEATWLNQPAMIDAAKRVFNGTQAKVSSAYLNSQGVENKLVMPPMLFMVANNVKISDDALASRFDIVNFPTPSKVMLLDYAVNKVNSSTYLKSMNIQVNDTTIEKIKKWIDDLPKESCNFRYIDAHVEDLLIA